MIGNGTNRQVITMHNNGVFNTNCQDASGGSPCTHEEADTCILLQLKDAVRHGNSRMSISTVDTDIVVLAVSSPQGLNIFKLWIDLVPERASESLLAMKQPELWVLIDVSLHQSFMPSLGVIQCPVFCRKRQEDCMGQHYGNVTPAFCALVARPIPYSILEWLEPLERFVCLLYDCASSRSVLMVEESSCLL